MDVKDPTVSFTKSRRAIAGTLIKFQIPARTYRWDCISGPAQAIMRARSHVLRTKDYDGPRHADLQLSPGQQKPHVIKLVHLLGFIACS